MLRTVEQTTMRKVYLRILPFAVLTYFFCYLDRINVGFAALTMNKDIGLDAAWYGMASGAFFWGYVLFEVPSNFILEKVGARLWIARIMITWGIISGCTAFAVGPYSFMAIRFLLGLAEAGLFPGFALYFTYWFPDRHRARINSGFTLALPIAVASGAPISTALLGLYGLWGLKGWQVLYVLEAIPTVLVGICVFFYLTDRPSEARWLRPEERDWLDGRMAHERRLIEAHHGVGVLRAFFDPKVVMLSLNYVGIVTASLGMLLFVPLIIKDLGVSNMQVGWLTMIPYIAGAISMVFCGWLSDHIGDRRWSLFTTCVISAVGLLIAGLTIGTWWSMAGITIAAVGTVLVDADDVPDRCRRGDRDRMDQLARQSRRVFRPVAGRLGQEPDRQLCGWALCPRLVCAGLRNDLAVLAAHSARRRCQRARGRPGRVTTV
jgi:ACS family tartrate transporter-like MFS transporter